MGKLINLIPYLRTTIKVLLFISIVSLLFSIIAVIRFPSVFTGETEIKGDWIWVFTYGSIIVSVYAIALSIIVVLSSALILRAKKIKISPSYEFEVILILGAFISLLILHLCLKNLWG
jgi:hypothetical protein